MWIAVSAAIVVAVTASGELGVREWEDLSVNSRNRLPPRTYSMPLADERAALTDALEPETPYAMSLNGVWKYAWTGDPALRAADFWKTDFDDSSWLTIDVPSCVELRGFGVPIYTTVKYPHAYDPKRDTTAPTIRDRDTDKPDYNPVSSYRRTFTVPEHWAGRDVILRFDGVYSAYYVWVNGMKVGYAEDSKLPSEFNITGYLRPDRPNLLCVEVYRWCDGSFLEDQDMTRYSGIFRDVTLWAQPKDGIWDFAVRTRPAEGYECWKLEVEAENVDSASLYDSDRKKVGDLTRLSGSNLQLQLKPRLWSAEDPYLYTLVIRKGNDIRMKRVGFKEQKVAGHTFLVNGKPVKFKGVNRHECSPENGRTVSLAEMLADVELMKRYNIDTVRTSHYPDHHLWYDLCDRYGLYVVAEANVEGHEPRYGENGLGRHREWMHSIVERNERHVLFYRNHACVTMWSVGNETGHGDCFSRAIAKVREIDPSRPIHWERGNAEADVDSRMYPTIEWLEGRGQFGDAGNGEMKREDGGIGYADAVDHTPGKCAFLCEYAHAMGNAVGNFQDYWDVFYRHESLCGGCIWDWVDQAVWKDTDRVDPKTGRRVRMLAYGGDFDEEPNGGPFNCNGVVDPLRHVTAKLVEVGHVHRNLVVSDPQPSADGFSFELWNRHCFTRADAFDGRWKLRADGVVVKEGSFDPPPAGPLSRVRFGVPGLAEALRDVRAGVETFVDFSFLTKKDEPWAARGWCVARDQVSIGDGRWDFSCPIKSGKPVITTGEKTLAVACGGTKAVFSRSSGTLCELEMNGKTILRDPAPGISAGPLLTCGRAFTDNDRWARDGNAWREDRKVGGYYSTGLSQLRYHAHPIVVEGDAVRIVTDVTGMKSAGFVQKSVWSFSDDGSVSVENTVKPHGSMPPALARLGFSLKLDASLENVRYYGRGPRENYVDRLSGSFFGVWTSTVTDQFEPYVRPQDNGYKCDVRWFELTDEEGRGVRFSASEPLFVQALHYGFEDLEFARHRAGQKRFNAPLIPRAEVCLNLDVRQMGLGGASCGPRPRDVFPIEETHWTLCFQAVDARTARSNHPAAEPGLLERVTADVAQPVRPGGVGGQPFWNGNSVWFMHPPSFDFPIYPGCKGYRFLIRDANAKWHEFLADTPQASLGEVWQDLPVGHTEVRCIAWEGGYHCLQMSSRTFWKMAPYRPGAYPKPDKTYLEAARAGFEYMLTSSHMRNFVQTGKPDPAYGHNCYPTKMHSATVRAMVRYAKLAPVRANDAHRLARTAADYLLSVSQPAGAPLAFFPPTYEGVRNTAGKYAGQNMLVYPADAGLAYLELYQATGEAKYLKAAENVAATYLRLQGDDGSWYLKIREKDGAPVNPNRLHPVGVLDFLDALYAETNDDCYREAADRAFGYFDRGPLVDWNWEGQFEDVKPSAKFINPSMYFAGSVAIRILRRWPDDPKRVAQAREILRWIEDQFVCWERPYKDEGLSFVGRTWCDWKVEPAVVEQFHYRQPVDSKAAKVAAAFLAMHRVSGDPLDLAKARTLGDACVRMQHADGRNPTIWTVEGDANPQADWMNCMYETLRTLADLAAERGDEAQGK